MKALVLLLFPVAALAQLTDADITRNTECGSPGVGKVWSGPRKGAIEPREGKPGYRVSAEGWWSVGCKMPPKPRDCPERKAPSWLVDGRLCQPVQGQMLPARNAPFTHDVKADPKLMNAGIQHWKCTPDGWVAVRASCR